MTDQRVDSPESASATDDETKAGAAEDRGDGQGAGVESSPPPGPAAPKPANDDLSAKQLAALEKQNDYLERIAGSTAETHKMTKELHDGILAEDEPEPGEGADEHEPIVSIVEPTPPPQPQRVTAEGGEPANGRPAKKGWRKVW